MSSSSPAVVLYNSTGFESTVVSGTAIPAGTGGYLQAGTDGTNARFMLVDTSGRPNIVGAAAVGASPAGNPLLLGGVAPSGFMVNLLAASQGALGIAQMSNDFVVQSAATVTATGSTLVTASYFGTQEIALIVNVGTVTGAGSIQYTIQEVDPGDATTVFGNSASTVSISSGNAPGVFTAVLNVTTSPMIKVSWVVTGTFSATIYSTVTTKTTPSTQTINGTITTTNNSVGTDGAAALGFDTQVGGKTTTAAPTYTNGNLDALSLTTLGGLRIDGVYAAGTANATAADVMNSGGYVTTAAPTYTTGQLEPLSIDTSGNLRTSVNNTVTVTGTVAVTQSTSPWIVAGGGTAGTPATGVVTVQGISGMTPLSVQTNKAATSSVTSVASSATNVQLLASNANRIFASIYNESSKQVFIKLGTTASNTSYTILLMPNSYWEVPNDYTGEIDAIWSAANGNARITELTP